MCVQCLHCAKLLPAVLALDLLWCWLYLLYAGTMLALICFHLDLGQLNGRSVGLLPAFNLTGQVSIFGGLLQVEGFTTGNGRCLLLVLLF